VEDCSALLFVGLRTELLELATNQSFDQIAGYSAEVGSVSKTVLCTVPTGEFITFNIPPEQLPGYRRIGAYVRFELEGTLRYSREGLVFGILPIDARNE